jgi:hypothetical protein
MDSRHKDSVFEECPVAQSTSNTSFYRYQVGHIEVCVVSDGYIVTPLAEGFIPNASTEEVQNALLEAGLPTDTLTTTFAPLIFKNGTETI